MTGEARHLQRLRKRRLQRLRNVSLAVGALVVVTGTVWAVAQIEPPEPDTSVARLPPPMSAAAAVTASPPNAAPTASPTADSAAPIARLAVLGDAGTRESMQRKIAAQVAAADRRGRPFDALLITGDLIYEDGDSDLTEASVVRPYATTFTKPEIIAALGNHDTESDEGGDIMRRLGRPSAVYVQDVGPVRVISLNSNNVGSTQTGWLERVLRQPRPANSWLITVMHHPAFSSGDHGSEEDVQREWAPLFARHGVDLALAGHDHNYERTKPQNGVTYIVSGGGGAELRDVGRSSFTALSAKKHHFVELNVFASQIVGRAIDDNGRVFDTFVIPAGSGR